MRLKRLLKLVLTLAAMLVLCGLIVATWLYNPFDKDVWRVRVPISSKLQVPVSVYQLIKLANSPTGRYLVRQYRQGQYWHTTYGRISISTQQDLVHIACQPCRINHRAISPQALPLQQVSFWARRQQNTLSGWVEIANPTKVAHVFYLAQLSPQGVQLQWSLPSANISQLLAPFKSQSAVIAQAHIIGNFSATGELNLPSQTWRMTPSLEGFEVMGLGTEQLKSNVVYRCHSGEQLFEVPEKIWLSPKQMGAWLPRAVLIAEDANFLRHPGYDLTAMTQLLNDTQRPAFGASTITQQLAKNIYTGGERTVLRKLEELLYATEMERTLGKKRILHIYLNTVDWGPETCGARAAAQHYFGTLPTKLNATQAVWLASILHHPHKSWQQEYLPNAPNKARMQWIMQYMPKRAKKQAGELAFVYGAEVASAQ